jgi:hypothetical protein
VEVPNPETPKRASAAAELPQTEVRTKRTCAGRKAAASEKEKRPSEQEKEVVRRSDPGLCGLRLASDLWHCGRCVQ